MKTKVGQNVFFFWPIQIMSRSRSVEWRKVKKKLQQLWSRVTSYNQGI